MRYGSNSEIECYRQCPRKHHYNYGLGWLAEPSEALSRGTLWHHVMEAHYTYLMECQQSKQTPLADELYPRITQWLYDEKGDQTEEQALVEWMYTGYVKQYGMDSDWRILAVEHPAEMWLPTPKGGRSGYRLRMKIDLVIMDRMKHIWLVDHKTCKDLPTDRMLELDPQFGLYTWGLRNLGKNVFGQIHSASRTLRYKDPTKPQPLEERFRRTMMYRTDEQLDNIARDAYYTMRTLATDKTHVRHFDSDTCRWKCDYLEPCLAGSKGIDEEDILRRMGYHQGDPNARYA